jgi:glutamine amidotransferase
MSKKIIIVDYQLGNLFSVNQVLVNIGLQPKISSESIDIESADAIVLPGVGAFKDAMDNLNALNLSNPIIEAVRNGKPLFGICLGLQLLFTQSEEFGSTNGLGLIEGDVRKFKTVDAEGRKVRVPQIAWNTIYPSEYRTLVNTPLENITETDMYFVHSYYVAPKNKKDILTETYYSGLKYTSSVLKNNIFACQFHPEKSAQEGIKVYKNWALLNNLY